MSLKHDADNMQADQHLAGLEFTSNHLLFSCKTFRFEFCKFAKDATLFVRHQDLDGNERSVPVNIKDVHDKVTLVDCLTGRVFCPAEDH